MRPYFLRFKRPGVLLAAAVVISLPILFVWAVLEGLWHVLVAEK